MSTWSNDDLPECLIGYAGQHSSTIWYKHLCEHFSKNYVVKTHYKGLKRYKNCFLASEAVTWLQGELATNKFKSTVKRNGVVKILAMMHKTHQVFEDVRGTTYNVEGFSDNSRLFRFKKYSVELNDSAEDKVPGEQDEKIPFSQHNNCTSCYNISSRRCLKSSNSIFESTTSCKSFDDLSKIEAFDRDDLLSSSRDIPVVSRTLPKNSSYLNLGMSLNLETSEGVSEDVSATNFYDLLSSPSYDNHPQVQLSSSYLFPKRQHMENNSPIGFAEALELCSPSHYGHNCDKNSSEIFTRLRLSKSFASSNKENKKSVCKKFDSSSRKPSRSALKKFEDDAKFDMDYKWVIINSLCKKLKVDNIHKIIPIDLISLYNVKKNIKLGNKFEFISKNDFPETVCLMLERLSHWPLKTYCTYRVGTKKCDASVQSLFDAVLDYIELHPESIFPKHFLQLLVAVHDLCKLKYTKTKNENISRKVMMHNLPTFSPSHSIDCNQERKQSESSIVSIDKRLSPCKELWKTNLAKVSSVRHPMIKEELSDINAFIEKLDILPNKTMLAKDGGVYFYREFPQMMQFPGWRSHCSTLELGKRTQKNDLIITNIARQTKPTTISTLACESLGDLLVNKNIDVGEVDQQQFIEALQICFLMLSQAQRRNFHRLFRFVNAVITNRGICTLGAVPKKDMIVDALTIAFMRSSDNDILEPTIAAIFCFFVDEYEKVLSVPQLESNFSNDLNIQMYTEVSLSFCKRITVSEFEKQSSNFTRNALIQLLKTVVEDPSLTESSKKEHLKKFEESYPDIFYSVFPPEASSSKPKDLKARFVDSLRQFVVYMKQ